jgi:hypothetical protein
VAAKTSQISSPFVGAVIPGRAQGVSTFVIIASKNIPKYFHAITFPVNVLIEKGDDVALTVGRTDFMALIDADAIIGIGSWRRVRHFRLCRPLEVIQRIRAKILNRLPGATPLHYRDQLGDTHSVLVVKRHVCGGFHNWDNSFSVAEMKRTPNAIKSAATMAREAARHEANREQKRFAKSR